jgi:hypothetical protein
MRSPIGILTFHNGPNYGAFMQAWHLREAVRNLGEEAYIINYLHPDHVAHNTQSSPIRSLSSLKSWFHWRAKRAPFRGIADALCREPFTSNAAEVPWNQYRGILVGSDVVLDFQNPDFGRDPAYFGSLPGQGDTPFAAYAASCGKADADAELPAFVDGLRRFTSLGVRDRTTHRLVMRATGRDATLVVDPTWLGDDPPPQRKQRPGKPYVVVYGASVGNVLGPVLSTYCKKHGFLLVSAAARCPWADITLRSLHPFDWVDLIRGAEACVISGLHGTLYSIKYNKPFILVNNESTNQKVRLALERTGQGFRLLERAQLNVETIGLLEPEGGALPDLPTDWIAQSKDFLADSFAFKAPELQTQP